MCVCVRLRATDGNAKVSHCVALGFFGLAATFLLSTWKHLNAEIAKRVNGMETSGVEMHLRELNFVANCNKQTSKSKKNDTSSLIFSAFSALGLV